MHLMIDGYGMSIGKHSERVQIKRQGEVLTEVPLLEIDRITLATRGAVISTDLVEACVNNGIQINFLDYSGRPLALISSPNLNGTVITRRKQIEAFHEVTGTVFSKQFVRAKLTNQLHLIKYFAKYRKLTNSPVYNELQTRCHNISNNIKEVGRVPNLPIDLVRGQLLSIEGRAGREYWRGVKLLIGKKVPEFAGREHRGASDLFNCMLNYGYGILYSQIWGALMLAGLEPFAGFLHVDRPGKPSLVLDFIEEFRQPVVDHAIIALLGKSGPREGNLKDGMLSPPLRKEIALKVEERLNAVHRYQNCNLTLKAIIQRQARLLAAFFRGETRYRPFVGGW